METPRPHQKSVSSFPRREYMQQDIPKSPLLFYTPVKKPCSQLAKKEDGEGNTSIIAKENAKATENLLVSRINGANVHNSTCSTPIKTPFGTPSHLQTPNSKLSFLSARANTHSVGTGACRANEDASITRTPFGLLAGKNLNACLFSPSHTLRPIAFPAPFDKLASPSLKGHAKRVLLMPPQLSPARRVPLKQKRSQSTTTGKQSPFVTPKSSRVDNVQFVTPKSSRVDNVFTAAAQNDDVNARQHHDVHNVDVNYEKKRVLASTPRQSPFAIPNSSRVEHVLKTDGQNNGVSGGKMMQHHDPDVNHGRAKLDRVEFLNRMLASMPQLSSPARRVPLQQKQKQPIKSSSPLHHKEKQQSSNKKPLSETPKTCKSSQRRKKTCQNEAAGLDVKRQAAGSHQKATKKLLKRVPKGKAGDGTDKAKQKNVDNHEIKGGSSNQHDEDINKKYGNDSVDNNGNDVKQHEACDVDVGHDEYCVAAYAGIDTKHCDGDGTDDSGEDSKCHFDNGIDTKHCDEDGTKHHADDYGEDGKCHFDNGRDDEKQLEDGHVDVGGADDTEERYRDGSKKHYEEVNCTKQHDHDEGDDDNDICIGSSDDTDGEKQHGDDDIAKQHDQANGVKQHNDMIA